MTSPVVVSEVPPIEPSVPVNVIAPLVIEPVPAFSEAHFIAPPAYITPLDFIPVPCITPPVFAVTSPDVFTLPVPLQVIPPIP